MGNCCGQRAQYLDELEYKQIVQLHISEKDRTGRSIGKYTLSFSLLPPSDQSCMIFDLLNTKVKVSGCILPGFDPHGECGKECQDSYAFATKENNLFAVLLDGHGKEGRKVSLFCRDYMMNYFYKNYELFEQDPQNALENVIESCDNELLSSGIECNLSGTTAVVVIINTLGIHAGSVGDSRSVLASLPKDISDTAYTQYKSLPFKRPVKPIRKLNAVPLTIDQKPNHEEELKRIYKAGGVVEKLSDNLGRPVGPYRVWKRRSNLPGLAMSRSIGDGIAHNVGVISSPITHTFPLYTAYDQFIILASDGVWDVMENLEVVNLIERFRSSCQNTGKDYPAKTSNSTIARLVCEEARYRWFGIIEDDDVMIDDISCIIIELFYGESVLKFDDRSIEDRKINKFRSIAIENAIKGQMGVVRKDPTRGSMATEQAVIEEAIVELQSEEETQ
ncbi:hypothetical protein SteCoe_35784 [Stentor coeruleus]|uniref:PPM-type phosphatase domain-containing protein n=1 Tax=Stentor coeruleus TaxID=5963 RepID=A0A1R2ARI2_9CILI|nr:hypothetical protein SteCoe_35784 [Stentor coeruleus]